MVWLIWVNHKLLCTCRYTSCTILINCVQFGGFLNHELQLTARILKYYLPSPWSWYVSTVKQWNSSESGSLYLEIKKRDIEIISVFLSTLSTSSLKSLSLKKCIFLKFNLSVARPRLRILILCLFTDIFADSCFKGENGCTIPKNTLIKIPNVSQTECVGILLFPLSYCSASRY